MLAAPMTGQACSKFKQNFAGETFAGQTRGVSHEVGHRLRDAWYERAAGSPERIGVAIVGAGPAGLSAGWRLRRSDYHDYRIFDLEPRAGGTSAYGTDAVVPYPWGAHYVPVPLPQNRALKALLAEMNVLAEAGDTVSARERFRIREPVERLFYDGSWHAGLFPTNGASQQELEELSTFEARVRHWAGLRDGQGKKGFRLPMRFSSDDATFRELDEKSAKSWLAELGIRSQRVLWYLELACRDDYGMTLEQTSAWALLFYFCARRANAGAESQPFVTWPEGNGRLVMHLASGAKHRVLTNHLVTDVVAEREVVKIAVFDVKADKLRRFVADHAILAIPQFVVARVLRSYRDSRPRHLERFSYGAWMVANLHVRRPPKNVGAPPAWDNVLFDSPSLGYVSAGHQALRDVGPNVWTYYLPFTGPDPAKDRQTLLALSHQEAARAVVVDLSRAHPDLPDLVERVDIYKWGHAMVRPTPGFIWGEERTRAQAGPARVHFAHSDLSGMALFEEAQDRGVLAAERVLEALGRPAEPLAG